jgi:SsrA-binding protein
MGGYANHEPKRPRKLLLHKREVLQITKALEQKGYTLVPLSLYFNDRGIVKVQIALARGKRKADRREDVKKRDHKRDMDREMARQQKRKNRK